MRKVGILIAVLLALGAWTAPGQAVDYRLFESALNVDGTVSTPAAQLSFDSGTGLGSLSFSVTGVGAHYVALFVDHDIDEAVNTFFNESGAVSGAPGAGLSWEIDEPGYVFGNIYTNFQAGTLDNTIFDGVSDKIDDVAMALGWNFILADGETAAITFTLGTAAPGGFSLAQIDLDSPAAIYFTTGLEIRGGEVPVPEPATTLLLMGSGLGWLALLRKRMKR